MHVCGDILFTAVLLVASRCREPLEHFIHFMEALPTPQTTHTHIHTFDKTNYCFDT